MRELNVAEVQICKSMVLIGRSSSLICILPCFKNTGPMIAMPWIFMSLFPRYPNLSQSYSHLYYLSYVINKASNILYICCLLLTNIWIILTDTSEEYSICYKGLLLTSARKLALSRHLLKLQNRTFLSMQADSYWHNHNHIHSIS